MEFTIILSRKKSLLLKVFILFLYSLTTDEIPSPFTKVPPSVLYLVSGQDARMVWDYNVNNKSAEFGSYSPAWYYYRNTTKIQIASEHKWSDPKWQWKIAPTCPDSLKDRISKESTATLVISNVNMTDTGIYECGLTFISGLYSYSRATLTVTVPPTFLSSLPNKTYQIVEGQDLKINCTATGPPTPNITWVNITDDSVAIKSQGSGSAVLQIDDTKRYHAGVYECQAKNNPNENATTIRTSVIVYYKPSIFKEGSSLMLSSWNGRQTTLNCTVVDGKPTPTITWYTPSGHQITTAVTPAAKGSRVVITTSKSADYGLYKCKATNIAGSDERNITVTQLFLPGAPNVTILNQDIQASSVTVRWTKPGYDGGSPVIDYKVQINSTKPPQEHNTTEHKTHHEFTGLTKNTRYEVRVYSRNVVGHGNASITIFSTKKRGPPPLPNLDLFQSKTAITLFWKKPDENGGPIKNYTIYRKRGVETTWTSIHVVRDLSNLTYVIQLKDLEPGQTYWFIVTATNEFGESEKGSDEGKKANPYILSTALTPTPPTTTESDKPEINITATPNAIGCIGGIMQLVCKANGVPSPSMVLKDSSGNELYNTTDKGEISYTVDVESSREFDNYTCIAVNFLGNASHVIFSKEEPCPSTTANPGASSDVPAGVIAGVVIAGILAIAGLVIALIFCYRKKTFDKDSRTSGGRPERTVQMSSLPDHEDQYASVQHQQDIKQTPSTEPIPQYAQVDKSKKKRHNPDELVYADLALDSKGEHGSRPTSTREPANEISTVYADIAGSRQHPPEPQYGNLQGKDIDI